MAPASPAGSRRRRFVALVVGLVTSVLVLAPAQAQDRPTSTDVGASVDAEIDTSGGGAATGDRGGAATGGRNEAPSGDGVAADAVDDGDRSVQIIEADVSGYPDVSLVVAVPPALAGELSGDSFALIENQSRRSVQVAKLRDTIEVVVVIDTSGSMAGAPIDAAKSAARDFVGSLDRDTLVAVIGFGADAEIVSGFDANRRQTSAAIDDLRAGGETALYDALSEAAAAFGSGDSRRFVVVLSDGTDTASSTSLEAAAAAIDGSGAALYAITLESDEADFAGIRDLAGRVDGEVVAAGDAASLTEVYAAIASRLTNQYVVAYESATSGPTEIVLSVAADGVIATASEAIDLGGAGPADPGDPTAADGGVAPVIVIGEPAVVQAPQIGFLQSNGALYLGAVVLFLAIAAALFVVLSTEPRGPSALERLNLSRQETATNRRSGLTAFADRASSVAERVLDKQSKRGALDSKLEKAGMDMRPGEFIVASIGGALGFAAMGFVMMSPVVGLGAFFVGLLGSRFVLNSKAKKRQKKFGNQLGDTLMMVAGSLRAGHGIAEALDTVASQSPSPTCDEFGRAVSEARIGRDMVDSLYDIADRSGSEDFIWVVRAISINRELGGDLAEILDNVGETIRDRNRLRDQVRALSAEGKMSAMILFAMPVLVAIWVRISNPEYMESMTDQTAGKFVVGFAVMLLVLGGMWLKKLVNVEF